MNMSGVIESLYKVGKPLIIASDVEEMPYTVEKIRRAFSAIAYTPNQNTSVETKVELAAPFTYANDHERDALSAALDAYRQYRHKFQNLLKRIPPGHDLDEVRARVIRGQSLDQVISDMHVPAPVPVTPAPPAAVDGKHDDRVRVLDGMVKRLRSYIAELQEEIKGKDYEIHRLSARLRKARTSRDAELAKDAEVVKKDAVIQSLKKHLHKEERHNRNLAKRLARIKKFAELSVEGDVVPVKMMETLTREGIRKLAEDVGIGEGDVIWVNRTDGWGRSVIRDLAEIRVTAVIVGAGVLAEGDPNLLPSFREAGLPLISGKETGVQMRNRQGLCGKEALDAALVRWNDQQVRAEREKKTEMIEHIFKEYKSERGKEVRKGG
jgi:predicted RNase H-like nuclease (RuvC/YqgF family)